MSSLKLYNFVVDYSFGTPYVLAEESIDGAYVRVDDLHEALGCTPVSNVAALPKEEARTVLLREIADILLVAAVSGIDLSDVLDYDSVMEKLNA